MNFFYWVYFKFPTFSKYSFIGKSINYLLRMILYSIFNSFLPLYYRHNRCNIVNVLQSDRDEKYLVSLTSFPARINYLWLTIETLLRQTYKPDKIILWLGKEFFPNGLNDLPSSLLDLQTRGLIILFRNDIRSHTKYYYAMKEFAKYNIITVDDDIYYPSNLVETLVNLHLKNKMVICANRVHKIIFNRENIPVPYNNWLHHYKGDKPSFDYLMTGVGGVLYPPNILSPTVFDLEAIKRYCFTADDIWLYLNAIKVKSKIMTDRTYDKDFITVKRSQQISLVKGNVFESLNDKQFIDSCKYLNIDISDILNY